MTPANQHTGIERLSDERLAEIHAEFTELLAGLAAGGLKDGPGAVSASYTSLSISDVLALSLRASAEPQDHVVDATEMVGAEPGDWVMVPREPTMEMLDAMPTLPAIKLADPLAVALKPSQFQNRVRYLAAIAAAPHPHSSSAVDGVTEVMWSVLDQYDAETKSIALGHENVSLGRSTYNWRRTVSGEIRAALTAALAGGSNGRE